MGASFDGTTFDETRDGLRLQIQLSRVWQVMRDGRWRTLAELSRVTGGSEASVSARLRDLRKAKFGGHTVQRQYVTRGLWQYRVLVEPVQQSLYEDRG